MSGSSQGPSALKRKRQDSNSQSDSSLTEHERKLYDAIRSKEDMGMSKQVMKRETNLTMVVINKNLKTLEGKKKIKEVKGIHSKARGGYYMAVEFEPSNEITGGSWYDNGSFDREFVNIVKNQCMMIINKNEGASLKEILAAVESKKLLQVKLTPKDMKEILEALVLDNEIMKAGEDCYKCCKRGTRGEPNLASMASDSMRSLSEDKSMYPRWHYFPKHLRILQEMVGILNYSNMVTNQLYACGVVVKTLGAPNFFYYSL